MKAHFVENLNICGKIKFYDKETNVKLVFNILSN